MNYSEFVQRAIEIDKRNTFGKISSQTPIVAPEDLQAFYQNCNPIDVELPYEGTAIKLFSAEDLPRIQEEYSNIVDAFVFASCNGDPICFRDGKILIWPHGVDEAHAELLCDDFNSFILSLVE